MEFYAISLSKEPDDTELLQQTPENRVFESKVEALTQMKKWKTCQPRLSRKFETYEEALRCAETINNEDLNVPQVNNAPSEGCPFKGLTPQELKQIKEAIQSNNEDQLRQLVATNPRYILLNLIKTIF